MHSQEEEKQEAEPALGAIPVFWRQPSQTEKEALVEERKFINWYKNLDEEEKFRFLINNPIEKDVTDSAVKIHDQRDATNLASEPYAVVREAELQLLKETVARLKKENEDLKAYLTAPEKVTGRTDQGTQRHLRKQSSDLELSLDSVTSQVRV